MGLFKKLQENSLYWRYRFITRRFLAMKRWWRELRQPRNRMRVVKPAPRGMSAMDPYRFSNRSVRNYNPTRGIVFVVAVALLWVLLGHSALAAGGFPIVTAQLVMLGAAAYLFLRFW